MLVLFVFAMNCKNVVFIICAAAFYGDVLVIMLYTRCVRKVIGQGRHFVTFQSSCLIF